MAARATKATELTITNVPKTGHRFEKGNPGGPGRPKGSRHKINELFLRDFYEAWEAFGRPALLATAWTEPATFVKVAAALLPKEMHIRDTTLDDMTEDELLAVISAIRSQVSEGGRKPTGKRASEKGSPAQPDSLH